MLMVLVWVFAGAGILMLLAAAGLKLVYMYPVTDVNKLIVAAESLLPCVIPA
ncbi:hypothetical protein [Paenibacillus donghaensis]|uniref:hypothetical protein n=1 Tax=Paenibacillus donghaensis TaxID=414771 RepID=UPI0012F7AFEC|nr:hypothetical protein [Paenibacillus donghaensis]